MFRPKELAPGYRVEAFDVSGFRLLMKQNQDEVLTLIKMVTPRLHSVGSGSPGLKLSDMTDCVRLIKLADGNVNEYEIVGLACFKFEVRKKDGKRIMRYFGSVVSPGESRGLQQQLHAQALKYLKECVHTQVIDLSSNESPCN